MYLTNYFEKTYEHMLKKFLIIILGSNLNFLEKRSFDVNNLINYVKTTQFNFRF